jgi:hypothetical protein
MKISADEELVSFDVIGLFPSVPRSQVLDIIKNKLEQDTTLSDRTTLTSNEILDLLSFVLKSTSFQYNGEFYDQLSGVPMGSQVSVVVAEIMMEHLESEALKSDSKPSWYGRFVDDIACKIRQDNIDDFHFALNSVCPELQFTVERSKNDALPFLDGLIIREGSNLRMEVYRKPTHTDRYLDFTSNNPLEHKRAVATTLFHRALMVPTDKADKHQEVNRVRNALRMNGYPEPFLRNQLSRVKKRQQAGAQSQTTENKKKLGFTVLPYVPGVTERVQRVLKRADVQVAVSSTNTLRGKLARLKDPVEESRKRSVVYKIPCGACNAVYIGQTSTARRTRMSQHQADCKYKRRQKSELAEHHVTTGHPIDFERTSTLCEELDYRKRLWKESWQIAKHRPAALNRKTEIVIPAQYRCFV